MRVIFNRWVKHHNLYNVYTVFHLLVYFTQRILHPHLLLSFCFTDFVGSRIYYKQNLTVCTPYMQFLNGVFTMHPCYHVIWVTCVYFFIVRWHWTSWLCPVFIPHQVCCPRNINVTDVGCPFQTCQIVSEYYNHVNTYLSDLDLCASESPSQLLKIQYILKVLWSWFCSHLKYSSVAPLSWILTYKPIPKCFSY